MSFYFDAPEIDVAVAFKIKHNLKPEEMHALGWYLSRMTMKFPTADLNACASRWMAGKRAVTLPWTKLGKRNAAATRKSIVLHKAAIVAALAVVDETLKQQYREGKEKVLNAIVGKVIADTKINAAAVKIVVVEFLKSEAQ